MAKLLAISFGMSEESTNQNTGTSVGTIEVIGKIKGRLLAILTGRALARLLARLLARSMGRLLARSRARS